VPAAVFVRPVATVTVAFAKRPQGLPLQKLDDRRAVAVVENSTCVHLVFVEEGADGQTEADAAGSRR